MPSTTWLIGRNDRYRFGRVRVPHGTSEAIVSAIHRSCPWVNATPFGGPVVPDVYRIVASSSGPTGADAGTTASPSLVGPLLRKDVHEITSRPTGCSARQNDTIRSLVESSSTRSITDGAPTKRISERLRRSTSSRSSGGVVAYSGTLTPPTSPIATSTTR